MLILLLIFEPAMTFAGDPIDKFGHAVLNIPLNAATDSPFVFTLAYSSDPAAYGPIAGGWSIPMLESRVVFVNDRSFKIFYPNGDADYLEVGVESAKGSEDVEPVGVVNGQEITVSADGSDYIFSKGRLVKWKQKNGDAFEWTGVQSGLEGVRKLKMNGKEIVEVIGEKSGVAGKISIKYLTSGKTVAIVYDQIPDLVDEDYLFSAMNSFPSVRRIEFSDGKVTEFQPGRAKNQRQLRRSGWPNAGDMDLSLDDSGRLLSCNGVRYETTWMRGQIESFESGVPQIVAREAGLNSRLLQKGSFYSSSGQKTVFSPDEIMLESYFSTPTGERLRKRVLNGVEVYRAYFDSEGRKIRMVDNGKTIRIEGDEIIVE